mmetsp:Transcript_70424/g.198634  ORF Transcript_70424/g.198634 Transcript_70424/m.198634 type:complete len:159 (-) Transcript_70424:233-709(-)
MVSSLQFNGRPLLLPGEDSAPQESKLRSVVMRGCSLLGLGQEVKTSSPSWTPGLARRACEILWPSGPKQVRPPGIPLRADPGLELSQAEGVCTSDMQLASLVEPEPSLLQLISWLLGDALSWLHPQRVLCHVVVPGLHDQSPSFPPMEGSTNSSASFW